MAVNPTGSASVLAGECDWWSRCGLLGKTDSNPLAAPVSGSHPAMGRNSIPVSIIITLPVAAILGFLAGLGVGGGSLLMLWLTAVVGMEYAAARTINLLFFLPSAIISTIFHRKQGSVQLLQILPAVICGCIAAAVFSFISRQVDTAILQKLFGGLLLLTGLRELFYRPRNAR